MDDPRLTPARPDLAAKYLEGKIAAARFVTGEAFEISDALAPLRERPSSEAMLLTQALKGERVTVYDRNGEGWAWGQLNSDGYVGWLPDRALTKPGAAPTHKVTALRTFAFPGPSIKLPPIDALPLGAKLTIRREDGGFAPLPSHSQNASTPGRNGRGAPSAAAAAEQSRFDWSAASQLNVKYQFDAFGIGSGNQFAMAAAQAVAERPSKASPVWICSAWTRRARSPKVGSSSTPSTKPVRHRTPVGGRFWAGSEPTPRPMPPLAWRSRSRGANPLNTYVDILRSGRAQLVQWNRHFRVPFGGAARGRDEKFISIPIEDGSFPFIHIRVDWLTSIDNMNGLFDRIGSQRVHLNDSIGITVIGAGADAQGILFLPARIATGQARDETAGGLRETRGDI